MKKIVVLFFALLLLSFACSKNNSGTSPNENPDMSNLLLSMHKYGGWIPASILEVYGSGWVRAQKIPQASSIASDTEFVCATDLEQQKIGFMQDAFPSFEAEYFPQHYMTDQEYYYLISYVHQPPDTTSLYDLSEVVIPDELRRGIETLEQIWERAIPE